MNKRLQKTTDPWLIEVWSATLILVPATMAIFIAGRPAFFQHLQTVCRAPCPDNRLTAAAAVQWKAAGGDHG